MTSSLTSTRRQPQVFTVTDSVHILKPELQHAVLRIQSIRLHRCAEIAAAVLDYIVSDRCVIFGTVEHGRENKRSPMTQLRPPSIRQHVLAQTNPQGVFI